MKKNVSHSQQHSSLDTAIWQLKDKIQKRGDLPYVSVQQQLHYVEEMKEFELGRFLMERGGLNGYWTHYVLLEAREAQGLSPFADFLLKKSPMAKATQQRFDIFQKWTQKQIKEGCTFASIPCGLMGDLLFLDYSSVKNFKLVGIDIDADSLEHAKEIATKRHLKERAEFFQKDAWQLNVEGVFDLVTSNGLNIYVNDMQKVAELYRQFYQSLKSGGALITSFLTPASEWVQEKIVPQDLLQQKIVFSDILAANWQSLCPENTMRELMTQIGFDNIEIHYDEAHLYPTLTARKT